MTKMTTGETYSSDGPECPHCGFTFTPDGGSYYDEMSYTEDECPECKQKFSVQVYTSTSWTCQAVKPEEAGEERSR